MYFIFEATLYNSCTLLTVFSSSAVVWRETKTLLIPGPFTRRPLIGSKVKEVSNFIHLMYFCRYVFLWLSLLCKSFYYLPNKECLKLLCIIFQTLRFSYLFIIFFDQSNCVLVRIDSLHVLWQEIPIMFRTAAVGTQGIYTTWPIVSVYVTEPGFRRPPGGPRYYLPWGTISYLPR